MKPRDEAESLRHRLTEAQENLLLIQERKSEFVQQTDIPLQLIKDERRLRQEVEALHARLARVSPHSPPLEIALPAPPRPRTWIAVAGAVVGGLFLILAVVTRIGGLLPFSLSPATEPASALSLPESPSASGLPQPSPLFLTQVDNEFNGGNVRALAVTISGMLVAVDGEGVKRMGGQILDIRDAGDVLGCALTVAEGPDQRLWVGTHGHGLVELTTEGKTIEAYHSANETSIAEINAVAVDSEGGVWVGTGTPTTGVYLLDTGGRWHFYTWGEDHKYPVSDLALNGKELWVATNGGGLYCLNLDTDEWAAVYNHDTCTGSPICLADDHVLAIHVSPSGRKWIGTTAGLCALDRQSAGNVWLGCIGPGVLPGNRVTALTDDGEGTIFVGTADGLGIVDETMNPVRIWPIGGSLVNHISALAFDHAQHTLWVGTLGGGLSVWAIEENGDSIP